MNKADQIARAKLVEYAKKFFGVTARTNEHISVTPAQIAAFAAQVREGCRQDLIHLILHLSKDDHYATGKEALLSLGGTVLEGESIELWGLPCCRCRKAECVYCGRGFAIDPSGV